MKNGKVEVKVPLKTNARHLQQMYTGLETLQKMGTIRLEYVDQAIKHNEVFTTLVINNKDVVIDCKDSVEIEQKNYDDCDVYFKRSLSPKHFHTLSKIHPFGLYFEVYPSVRSAHTIERFLAFSENSAVNKAKSLVKALDTKNLLSYMPRANNFLPKHEKIEDISILFFTRLWNPHFDREFELSKVETCDRELINTLRIDCVRALRKEFGQECLVGLMDDEYSRKLAPDLILSPEVTAQRKYIELVKRSKVCITSTGLHGSIGAKFSEYLALGKLILSEPFNHVLTSPVEEGINYLAYNSPEQCVDKAKQMLRSSDENRAMIESNSQYSIEYLRPEKIMQRVIDKAISS
tara:strand:+ start:20423 stop:21469 length:1047 start_codon:yes stop_codon:yes gene_type:complete